MRYVWKPPDWLLVSHFCSFINKTAKTHRAIAVEWTNTHVNQTQGIWADSLLTGNYTFI